MADFLNKPLVMAILESANEDPDVRTRLAQDPSAVFSEAGMLIHPDLRGQFNEIFRQQGGPLLTMMEGDRLDQPLLAWPSIGCAACSIGAFVVGAAIFAVGAAALSTLTVSSPCVVGLAVWAGVSAKAALVFIGTLGSAVAGGIVKIIAEICGWIGACP